MPSFIDFIAMTYNYAARFLRGLGLLCMVLLVIMGAITAFGPFERREILGLSWWGAIILGIVLHFAALATSILIDAAADAMRAWTRGLHGHGVQDQQ
jgi:hypothetical protein